MRKLVLILVVLSALGYSYAVPLSLADCRRMALQSAESISIAELNCNSSAALKKATFTAFLPSLNALGSYMHSGKEIEYKEDLNLQQLLGGMAQANPAVTSDPFYQTLVALYQQGLISDEIDLKIGDRDNWVLGVELVQPIFTGGKILQQYKIAKCSEALTKEMLQREKSELLLKVDEAYWRVISLQQKVKLADSYLSLVQKHVEDLNNAYAEGIVTQNELLKAQVKLGEAKLSTLQAGNGYKLALMALNQVIGLEPDTSTELVPQQEDDVECPAVSLDTVLETRPDYQMLKRQKDINQSLHKIAISKYYPNIVFQGSAHSLKPNIYNSMEDEFGSSWQIGILAQMELFHFGERMQEARVTRNNVKISELKLQEAKELINLQISSFRNQFTEAEAKLEIAENSLEQAEENLRVCQSRFDEGMLRSSDLLEAQSLWQKSYSDKIDARMELNTKHSQYLKAIDALQ